MEPLIGHHSGFVISIACYINILAGAVHVALLYAAVIHPSLIFVCRAEVKPLMLLHSGFVIT